MAKTIRVTKEMRNIIDFYREQYNYDPDYDFWNDHDFVRSIMIRWLRENYDYNTCEEILNRP